MKVRWCQFCIIFILFFFPLSAFAGASCFREVYYEQNPSEKWRVFQGNNSIEFFLATPFDLQEIKKGASTCDDTAEDTSYIYDLSEITFQNLSLHDAIVVSANMFAFFGFIIFFFLWMPIFLMYSIYHFEFSKNFIINTVLKTTFASIAATVFLITLLCIGFFIFALLHSYAPTPIGARARTAST